MCLLPASAKPYAGEMRVAFPLSSVAVEHSRSVHIDPAPPDVGSLTGRGDAPRSEPLAALGQFSMQDPGFEVRRISLLGTSVNSVN